jgi:hypothetical protein
MIELNCSYEESKKILELGYDFSSICTKFEFRENEEATTLTFLYSCGEIMTMWNPRMSEPYSYHLKSSPASGIIPLIPKAALEKCLPLIDGVIWKRFPAAGDGLLRCTGLNHRTVETCTGFHEFLWCHENYPEQLKKKFDEVMG